MEEVLDYVVSGAGLSTYRPEYVYGLCLHYVTEGVYGSPKNL
jgi:hypothetical protein